MHGHEFTRPYLLALILCRALRLFGTFKSAVKDMHLNTNELPLICYDFQQWYNFIRPHQSLDRNTPEDVYWRQIKEQYRI